LNNIEKETEEIVNLKNDDSVKEEFTFEEAVVMC
jgi:hypothetical protein